MLVCGAKPENSKELLSCFFGPNIYFFYDLGWAKMLKLLLDVVIKRLSFEGGFIEF